MVLRQLIEALFQGISQEVELLTGLIKTSLGLKKREEGGTEEANGQKGGRKGNNIGGKGWKWRETSFARLVFL